MKKIRREGKKTILDQIDLNEGNGKIKILTQVKIKTV
jgi:hypothetical protein